MNLICLFEGTILISSEEGETEGEIVLLFISALFTFVQGHRLMNKHQVTGVRALSRKVCSRSVCNDHVGEV